MPYALLTVILTLLSFNVFAIRGEIKTEFSKDIQRPVVSIHKKDRDNILHTICSGTIINKNQILTAAHCFDDKNFKILVKHKDKFIEPKLVKINDKYQRTDIYDPDWGYLYEVRIEFDFALIEVDINFDKEDFVTLAKKDFELLQSTEISFSGYGQRANIFGMGEGEGVFRVSLPLNPDEYTVDRIKIEDGARGFCLGDSGGPAWAKNKEDKLVQMGVISQGDCNVLNMVERINIEKIMQAKYKTHSILKMGEFSEKK